MIVYKDLFAFATAPNTGEDWFIEACRLVGLTHIGCSCLCLAHERFQKSDLLKVSLVRHPFDWLYHTWWVASVCKHAEPFTDFERDIPWSNYLDQYLRNQAGEIGRLLTSYEADSYIRFEDLPDGLRELRSSLGVKGSMIDLMPPSVLPLKRTPADRNSKRSVCDAEKELCDAFDYW